MRFLSWFIWVPFLVAVSVFAISNRDFIQIDLWPTDYTVEMPLTLFGFVIFVFGYLLGYIISKINSL